MIKKSYLLILLVFLGQVAFAQFTKINIDSLKNVLKTYSNQQLITSFDTPEEWYTKRLNSFDKFALPVGLIQESLNGNLFVFELKKLNTQKYRLDRRGEVLTIYMEKDNYGIENTLFREFESARVGRMTDVINIYLKPDAGTEEVVKKIIFWFEKCKQ